MSEDHVTKLAEWLSAQARAGVRVAGVNGAQGSGKSTLCERLGEALGATGLRVVTLALDDLYLGRTARERLAREVHPLLRTRGVPGTHEVNLGLRLLDGLRALKAGETLAMPRFVKVLDDRAPQEAWPLVTGPVDLVLFEGWCVATPPQAEAELAEPVNVLEAREDADGRWRRWVNQQLAGAYAPLFACIERLIYLKAPDFEAIHRWRLQQERGNAAAAPQARPMDANDLRRFIQHYERLTRHAMRVLPGRADLTVELGPEHEWAGLHWRPS